MHFNISAPERSRIISHLLKLPVKTLIPCRDYNNMSFLHCIYIMYKKIYYYNTFILFYCQYYFLWSSPILYFSVYSIFKL